jgi:uncharacterized membrane protein (DUF485 family)
MISSSSVFNLVFATENNRFFVGRCTGTSDLIWGVSSVLTFDFYFGSFLILFLSGFSLGCMAGRSDIAWFTSVHRMMMTLIIERVFVTLVRNHVDKRSSTCCSLSAY